MKDRKRIIFEAVPDRIFIIDAYGYVLDHNGKEPFKSIKKGVGIKNVIGDYLNGAEGVVRYGKMVFRRKTTPLIREGSIAGYTIILTDITEQTAIMEQRKEKSEELKALANSLAQSNTELEKLAFQVRELTGYSEHLRLARAIHDNDGHALTELYTICGICKKIKDSDRQKYLRLLNEGKRICADALKQGREQSHDTLSDIFEAVVAGSDFPVRVNIDGAEPVFIKKLYPLIYRICREAYHNTLEHSLADTFYIEAALSGHKASIRFFDNGCFQGSFEKGFGLDTMEKSVIDSGGSISFIAEQQKGFEIKVCWFDNGEKQV